MLSEIVINYEVSTVSKDMVMQFGDEHDGVIEFVGLVDKGFIEVGYYYGDDKPKNIIVISSQVGCPMACKFCEAGSKKFVRNLTPEEMYDQVMLMLKEADRHMDIDVKHKVNIAKTGEPLFNMQLVEGLERIAGLSVSFKVATILPRRVMKNFYRVSRFASSYDEPVQMQVSLISTSEEYRREASGRKVASFKEIRYAADHWMNENPERKINLSLILTEDVPCAVNDVCDIFPPELFVFRFRNYVPTENGGELETISEERLARVKKSFRDKGYDVWDWATPTATEMKFGLAANVTLKRYMKMVDKEF